MEAGSSAVDQLMKVDASAMVAIIRDLEHKLTEYQRQDKPPAWAIALEQRLEQLEKWRMSGPVGSSATSSAYSDNATSSGPTLTSVADDKLMAKVRGEIEAAIGGVHLQLDSKVSACGLEVDRLMKLLQIRPTNADLQQVIVSLRSMESKTQDQLSEMQNQVLSTLREHLSSEMVGVVSELKQGSSKHDEYQHMIKKHFQDYSQELTDLRVQTVQNHEGLSKELHAARSNITSTQEMIKANKAEVDKELQQVNALLSTVQADLQAALTQQQRTREEFSQSLQSLSQQWETHQKEIYTRIEQVSQDLSASFQNQLLELESDVQVHKHNTQQDLRQLSETVSQLQTSFSSQQQAVQKRLQYVDDFAAMDFPSKLSKLDDRLNTLCFEVNEISQELSSVRTKELPTLAKQYDKLREQWQTVLPGWFEVYQLQLQAVTAGQDRHQEALDGLHIKAQGLSDELDRLRVVRDETQALQATSVRHEGDLQSLHQALTANVDANDECIHRLEELEENLEALEATIPDRMNRIRDTLMESLLERQAETQQAVQHVAQNLEAISLAGEVGAPALAPGPPRPAAALPLGASFSSPLPPLSQAFGERNDPGDGLSLGGGGAGAAQATLAGRKPGGGPGPVPVPGPVPAGMLKKGQSFKRPSMAGALVRGTSSSHLGGDEAAAPLSSSSSSSSSVPGGAAAGGKKAGRASAAFGLLSSFADSGDDGDDGGGPGPARRGMSAARTGVGRVSFSDHTSPSPPRAASPPAVAATATAALAVATAAAAAAATAATVSLPAVHGPEAHAPPPPSTPHPADPLAAPYPSPLTNVVVSQARGDGLGRDLPRISHANNNNSGSGSIIMSPALSQALGGSGAGLGCPHTQEAQFVADLCVNFEEITVRRKRMASLPPVMCRSLVEVCCGLADFIASSADFDMVEAQLLAVHGSGGGGGTGGVHAVHDVVYDEHFVLRRRAQQVDSFLDAVHTMVLDHYASQLAGTAGGLRTEARSVFVMVTRKAVEMFLTKHNQVLVAGNSRLGRMKIPTCIACDRPLLDKVKLDHYQVGGSLLEDEPATPSILFSRSAATGQDAQVLAIQNGQAAGSRDRPRTTSSLLNSGSLAASLHSGSTSDFTRESGGYVLKAGFKMPKKAHRTPPLSHNT